VSSITHERRRDMTRDGIQACAGDGQEDGARGAGTGVVVTFAGAGNLARAQEMAARLHAPLSEHPEPDALALRLDDEGLALVGDGMELRDDLSEMLPRLRPDRLSRELLVRAARIKASALAGRAPLAVDATAGLGTDSLLLAAAGFEVTMLERDPVIAALLADALERAAGVPELAGAVGRMRLVEGDSVAALGDLGFVPDVVYLDPMFPQRRKSAAVKKKFQLLHRLERPCGERDQEELLRAALAASPRKVVIKRPAKGPLLAGAKPSYSIAGKAARYDCIVPATAGQGAE
jgi:16S rRNA (guanine1516-N2)-methyltransferase